MLKAAFLLREFNEGKVILTCFLRHNQCERLLFSTTGFVPRLNADQRLLSLRSVQVVLHFPTLFMERPVITYITVNGLLQAWWVPCQASEEVFQIHHGPSLAAPPLHYQHQIVVCLHPSHTISHPFTHDNRAAALYSTVDLVLQFAGWQMPRDSG